MADDGNSERKPVKKGVLVGGGPPPGYKWNVNILHVAHVKAMEFLDESQYAHMRALVRELAREDDPTHSQTVDVKAIEAFFEIRDKGGILGKIAARVFFLVHHDSRTIVVLGATKKEAEGQTPTLVKVKIRRRMREYLARISGIESK